MGHDLPEYRQAASQYRADRLFVKDPMNWHGLAAFINSANNVERGGLLMR